MKNYFKRKCHPRLEQGILRINSLNENCADAYEENGQNPRSEFWILTQDESVILLDLGSSINNIYLH